MDHIPNEVPLIYKDVVSSELYKLAYFKNFSSRWVEFVQGGGIHLKAFPQLIFAKLNHYVIATLENRKCDAAVINVGINVTC